MFHTIVTALAGGIEIVVGPDPDVYVGLNVKYVGVLFRSTQKAPASDVDGSVNALNPEFVIL